MGRHPRNWLQIHEARARFEFRALGLLKHGINQKSPGLAEALWVLGSRAVCADCCHLGASARGALGSRLTIQRAAERRRRPAAKPTRAKLTRAKLPGSGTADEAS